MQGRGSLYVCMYIRTYVRTYVHNGDQEIHCLLSKVKNDLVATVCCKELFAILRESDPEGLRITI